MRAIFDLDEKLTQAGIPHILQDMGIVDNGDFGWQIVYPDNEHRKGDVVCNIASYGHEQDLLEAMGFDITKERDGDDVVGYLTADQAFEYFARQWGKDNKDD